MPTKTTTKIDVVSKSENPSPSYNHIRYDTGKASKGVIASCCTFYRKNGEEYTEHLCGGTRWVIVWDDNKELGEELKKQCQLSPSPNSV